MDVSAEGNRIRKTFKEEVLDAIAALREKDVVTYADALQYASETGQKAGRVLSEELMALYPDGIVPEADAARLLPPTLRENNAMVLDAAGQAQKAKNLKEGVHLNAVLPEYNADYEQMLVRRVADPAKTDKFWTHSFPQSVENMAMCAVDDTVRANADFQTRSGIHRKIRRHTVGECCQWCSDLAGTYDYESVNNTGNDVWRRHKNCDCLIEDIRDGRRGIVYNYREANTPKGREMLERRRIVGIYGDRLSGGQRNVLANQRLSAMSSTDDGETRRFELGRIDPSRSQETIDLLNEQIRNEEREHAVVIDRRGNVVYFIGDSSGVTISDVDLTGAYVTHNHPISNGIVSFGKDDFLILRSNQQIAEFECVNRDYTYRARVIRPIDNISYNDAWMGALDETERHPEDDQQHFIMEWLKKEGYIEYDRQRSGKK